MPRRLHVIITGTGRCGTTFLVELLTHLGLATGYSVDQLAEKKCREARAGLEHDVRCDGAPYICKSPQFCDHAEEVMRRDDIEIEHIFVPVRDLEAAAESRRFVTRTVQEQLSLRLRFLYRIRPWFFPGGLWQTGSTAVGAQEQILLNHVYKLMLTVSNTSLPLTLLRYPRIVTDCPYLYAKLQPILKGVSFYAFRIAFNKTVRPELVHTFTESDRQAMRAGLTRAEKSV